MSPFLDTAVILLDHYTKSLAGNGVFLLKALVELLATVSANNEHRKAASGAKRMALFAVPLQDDTSVINKEKLYEVLQKASILDVDGLVNPSVSTRSMQMAQER